MQNGLLAPRFNILLADGRTRESAEDAIRRFNGEFIGHRRVRCSWAQHKQDPSANDYVTVDQSDPTNANGERPLLCTVAPVIQHDYVTVDQSDPTNANGERPLLCTVAPVIQRVCISHRLE